MYLLLSFPMAFKTSNKLQSFSNTLQASERIGLLQVKLDIYVFMCLSPLVENPAFSGIDFG